MSKRREIVDSRGRVWAIAKVAWNEAEKPLKSQGAEAYHLSEPGAMALAQAGRVVARSERQKGGTTMVRLRISSFVGALVLFGCAASSGAECRFLRVGCAEGVAPENLAIRSDELGQIFLEFDTLDLHNYVIQDADWLWPSPAWETVRTVVGDGKRSAWLTTRTWSRTFAGACYEGARSVQQTSDGGYIVVGKTRYWGPTPNDVYVLKTDGRGREQWSATFGGPEPDAYAAYSVRQTRDGGYIIAGETVRRSVYADVYLIKTDGRGHEEWSTTFGGDRRDVAYCVRQTSDGGYVLAGETRSFGAGSVDAYLIKTDSEGNEEWSRTFGGVNTDCAFWVQQTSDGGFVLAGYTYSFGGPGADVYLIKTDSQGKEEWSRTLGGAGHDWAFWVDQTADGGYIVAGGTESFGAAPEQAYLLKTDSRGKQEWSKTFGTPQDKERACCAHRTSDGGYVLTGSRTSTADGWSDVYLVKTDSRGQEEWSRTFGGYWDDHGWSVQETSDGGYIVAGETVSFGNPIAVYLIKTDRYGNAPAVPED
jgi:hypothetical protein